ncbi:heat shock transcription factor, X-linked-like isoform X2 [Chroicocephalus ridibundus]|uniref:heat shock transcription factor, X-linked-like isoform X2 n=1 Tax=Chroicocephalus ridibundus TaxID=1192867 RepID=UPI002FDE4F24
MSHWCPRSPGTSRPSLADWQDKARLLMAMDSEENFCPTGTEEMKRQESPAEIPSISAPAVLGYPANMISAGSPGQGERAPCDAAVAEWNVELDVQPGCEGRETKQVPPVSNKAVGEANEFSALHFPQKLWKVVESLQFQSIWWSADGKCVAINEGLFKEEVLGGGRPQQVFGMNSMKSFLRQTNLYGFTKQRQDFQRSASLPEFLAEEAAASAHSQILYYYNPTFHRDHPHLLASCKRRVGVRRRALDAPAVDEGHPSRSPGAQPAGDTQAPPKRWAEAPPSLSSSIPPPPPAAAPTIPEPAGAAGSQRF